LDNSTVPILVDPHQYKKVISNLDSQLEKD